MFNVLATSCQEFSRSYSGHFVLCQCPAEGLGASGRVLSWGQSPTNRTALNPIGSVLNCLKDPSEMTSRVRTSAFLSIWPVVSWRTNVCRYKATLPPPGPLHSHQAQPSAQPRKGKKAPTQQERQRGTVSTANTVAERYSRTMYAGRGTDPLQPYRSSRTCLPTPARGG